MTMRQSGSFQTGFSRSSGAVLVLVMGVAAAAACSSSTNQTHGTTPPAASAPKVEGAPSASALDDIFATAWTKAGVHPSPLVDDASYARRITLDLIGRIPTSTETRAFIADKAPDKRQKLVDKLLASEDHAANLARVWTGILMGAQSNANNADTGAFQRWLELRFSEKASWDRMATEILTANGKNTLGGPRGVESYQGGIGRAKEERLEGINAGVNFVLRRANEPQNLAGDVSRIFLGVQIQCAECHDHKTEKWKQTDFQSFAAIFNGLKPQLIDKAGGTVTIFDLQDTMPKPKNPPKMDADERAKIAAAPPKALDGTDLSTGDRREALAKWMTAPNNPWFAKAMTNRVWSSLMGAGFVEPIDDFREKNPAILPEALDRLAADFQRSGYDLDGLYREICTSQAYQRSVVPGEGTARDVLFSRADLMPMSSDQLLDSILVATELDQSIDRPKPPDAKKPVPDKTQDEKAKEDKTKEAARFKLTFALRRRLAFVFEEDAESNAGGYDGTVQQALMLMNGTLAGGASSVIPGDTLESVVRSERSDPERIDELYVRTLNRPPTPEETKKWLAFLDAPRPFDVRDAPIQTPSGGNLPGVGRDPLQGKRVQSKAHSAREQAWEDMFWTLLNSSEFFFRR